MSQTGAAQTHVTSFPPPDLPGHLLCRIALGLQPDDLPPPPPSETELDPDYEIPGDPQLELALEENKRRLRLAWEEFRARRRSVAAFRCVCRAWRAALNEGVSCLPTWLSPEAALHPVGPWQQRLHTLCLAVPGQVVKEHPDLDTWQQRLTQELHALYPNLAHVHFRVIDLVSCLEYLKWHIGGGSEAEQTPKWQGYYPAMDEAAHDIPALVLDCELLPEGPAYLSFMHAYFKWTGKEYPCPEGDSWSDSSLECQGPLTLRALMPLVEHFFLAKFPEMNEEGSPHHLRFEYMRHHGGGRFEMYINFWPSMPNPYEDEWD